MSTSVLRRAPGSPALMPSAIRRIADAMLIELELQNAELSVLLTNDTEIHALNLQHRQQDKPTDVLSFPLDEGEGADGAVSGTRVLGDVVISLDTAARQARGRKRELLPEVRFLLAHGILHLLGYDHGNPREKREMDALTRRLVRAVSDKSTKALKRPAQSPRRQSRAVPTSRPKAAKELARARASHAK
jgi:probable rRNA maturation factor